MLTENTSTFITSLEPTGCGALILFQFSHLQYVPILFYTKKYGTMPTCELRVTVQQMINITNAWQHAKLAYDTYKIWTAPSKKILCIDGIYFDWVRTGLVGFDKRTT